MEEKIKKLIEESNNELEKYVLTDLLEVEQNEPKYGTKRYLKDLFQNGCQSGMVSGLMYYCDTDNFFKKFSGEIDELREEMEEDMGEPLKIGYPLTNWLAWFGYEEMARKIADKLELEY